MSDGTLFLHVGTRKSGTTYLQRALSESVDVLAGQDVRLVYRTRQQHVNRLLVPLTGADPEAARAAVARLADGVRRDPARRHVVTLEEFAALPAEVVDVVRDGLADIDLHVIVTARPWRRTIPSEWQQDVKAGATTRWVDYLSAISRRAPGSEGFLARQDLPDIARRWGADTRPERVHVIAVPPVSRTTGTLVQLFCGLVGIDPTSLRLPDDVLNASMSLAQAELLRRVNAELGEWRADPVRFRRGLRMWLTRGVLLQQRRDAVALPREYMDWCAGEERRQLDELRALGVDLLGDPDDLVPPPQESAHVTEPAAEDVAEVGASVVADLVRQHWDETVDYEARIAELSERVAELERAAAAPQRTRWGRRG